MSPPLRIETTKPLILAGRNATYKIGPNPAMKEQWMLFMEDFGKIAGQVGYLAYGVCHNFDGQGHIVMSLFTKEKSQSGLTEEQAKVIPGRWVPYTSMLASAKEFTYGYHEVRFSAPILKGVGMSVWMQSRGKFRRQTSTANCLHLACKLRALRILICLSAPRAKCGFLISSCGKSAIRRW